MSPFPPTMRGAVLGGDLWRRSGVRRSQTTSSLLSHGADGGIRLAFDDSRVYVMSGRAVRLPRTSMH